jgi:hypothetical protein
MFALSHVRPVTRHTIAVVVHLSLAAHGVLRSASYAATLHLVGQESSDVIGRDIVYVNVPHELPELT